MLRDDVVKAVNAGTFHIIAIGTIDQGVEVLTGMVAGALDETGRFPDNSINGLVEQRLMAFAKQARAFRMSAEEARRWCSRSRSGSDSTKDGGIAMTTNEGVWDRAIRIVAGIALGCAAWVTWPGTENLTSRSGAVSLVFLVIINAQPDRLDLNDLHIQMARQAGVKLVVSTDAHRVQELECMRYGVDQARRGWCEARDVANTCHLAAFKKLIVE